MQTFKLMVSAGEASGDMHAAAVIEALKQLTAEPIECFGMGGKHLHRAGMRLLIDIENHSVMGFVEVVKQYPRLRRQLKSMRAALSQQKPDLLLLVDYPGFNMRLARDAQQHNIPVVYFIAPKIWASRAGRMTHLKKNVDVMAVILPFEVALYNRAGVRVKYVGNPILDNKALTKSLIEYSPPPQEKQQQSQIALLPGSRMGEINHLLATMLEGAAELRRRYPNCRFILPVADTVDTDRLQQIINTNRVTVELIAADDYDCIKQSRMAIVASGTATLELAVLGVPMVVVYRLQAVSYWLARRMLLIKNVSLVNIVAGKTLCPELLQSDCNTENIVSHSCALIEDSPIRQRQLVELSQVRTSLGDSGAANSTAALITKLLRSKPCG